MTKPASWSSKERCGLLQGVGMMTCACSPWMATGEAKGRSSNDVSLFALSCCYFRDGLQRCSVGAPRGNWTAPAAYPFCRYLLVPLAEQECWRLLNLRRRGSRCNRRPREQQKWQARSESGGLYGAQYIEILEMETLRQPGAMVRRRLRSHRPVAEGLQPDS